MREMDKVAKEKQPNGEMEIPVVEIDDPYAYVTSSRVIALLTFRGTNGERKTRKLLKTKTGYIMQ